MNPEIPYSKVKTFYNIVNEGSFIKGAKKLFITPGAVSQQIKDLEETIRRSICDAVVIATPTDLRRRIRIDQPTVRATYDFDIDLTPFIDWLMNDSREI